MEENKMKLTDYQEICCNYGKQFWGQKDAPLCESCSEKYKSDPESYVDYDGYPTDTDIDVIQNWNPLEKDPHELMALVGRLWYYADWGWSEEEVLDDSVYGHVINYNISTAGWSGNESLIGAIKNNKHFFWSLYWESSRRGGHYVIQIPVKK